MPYLNVTEVESALAVATSAPYTAFTELITLPTPTWEGRTCHAIRIGTGGGPERPGVYLLGGVHAREWGSADILINFVEQLEHAYETSTALTLGTRTFSAQDIQAIVETLDIVVFPQANPDGRNHSMTTEALWRKNRRTVAPNSAACPGVDVNRNFDFLWDFPTYFNVAASGISDSTDPIRVTTSCTAGRARSQSPRAATPSGSSTPSRTSGISSTSTATERTSSTAGATMRTRPPIPR